jgi:hypothetical protein
MPGKRLGFAEFKVIENCLVAGMTQRQIVATVSRSPSTICRELARNHNWWYRPSSPLRHTARPRRLVAYRYCYRAETAHNCGCSRAKTPGSSSVDTGAVAPLPRTTSSSTSHGPCRRTMSQSVSCALWGSFLACGR